MKSHPAIHTPDFILVAEEVGLVFDFALLFTTALRVVQSAKSKTCGFTRLSE